MAAATEALIRGVDAGVIVADAGTGHVDLIDPPRVESHVEALVDRLTGSRQL